MSHLQTSLHLHCQIPHSSWVLRIVLLAVVWQRTRNHLQQPENKFPGFMHNLCKLIKLNLQTSYVICL